MGEVRAVEARPKVKSCVLGLDWDVETSEAESQLSATVVFKEEVWESLQGTSGGSSFREAVSFELSDKELRATYMGSSVLELRLPQAVDPTAASAKLSSKQRRVVIRVPLSSGGSTPKG